MSSSSATTKPHTKVDLPPASVETGPVENLGPEETKKGDANIDSKRVDPADGVHELSREVTKDLTGDPDLTDPTTVILGGIFDTIYSLQHIIVSLVFAYFVGWFGFHISWVIGTFFIVWALDRKYKETGWNLRFKRFLYDEKKRQVVAAEKESCEWLNVALQKFFPIYSPGIADSVESAIIGSIESAMPVPPAPITHVSVQGVDLGVNPPSLERIKVWNLEGHNWQMDCTLKYHGDIRIVVAAGIGMKGVSVNMPVAIKDLVIEGRLRITLSMAPEPPLYKTLTVAFKSKPKISIGVEPLKAGDLDKGPLGNFLRDTIVNTVSTMMVYPQRLTIELGEPRPEGSDPTGEVLSADERADAEVDPDEGKPMTKERAAKLAKQRKPEYIGELQCVVLGAKDLRACDKTLLGKGKSDPFCRVFCGAKVDNTSVISGTLTPEWNKEMRFLVERAKKYQQLEVQVYDHDKVGKNDSLGRAIVDFSDMVGPSDTEPKEIEVALEGKKAAPGSTVRLRLAYIVD